MKKEKKTLFDDLEFNDAAYAQVTLDANREALEKNRIGLIISIFIPFFDLLLLIFGVPIIEETGCVICAIIAAVIAYLFGGGLKTALQLIWRITMTSIWLFPIFPIDLLIGLFVFMIVAGCAVVLPVVIILINRHQIKKNIEDAEAYLNYAQMYE